MRHLDLRAAVATLGALTILACSEKKPAPEPTIRPAPAPEAGAPAAQPAPPPAAEAPPAEAPAVQPAPEVRPEPAPAAPAVKPAPPSAPAAKPAPAPAAQPAPAPAPAAPAPAAEPAPAPKPEAPAAAAHAKVGPMKCKMCHKVQYESWAASRHAEEKLDCEGCHGNGGDYWPASVMRDRARAVAAGLVLPGLSACKECHPKADAALFAKVHAHKAK